ncbi:MAG: HAD-IA family hydrolase [Clostridia bacterium]|nr:HAD-IA family hydrolase [Clostridia bacterium]
MIKVLFFDIGYTLVNEDAVWKRRCEEQAETVEAKALGLTADDIYREIEAASRTGAGQFRSVLRKLQIKEAAPYRHELETLYDDAPQVLEALCRRYELGIIANQADGLRERLDGWGVLQYFKHVVSSFDVKITKPDIRIFEHALNAANCPPESACMIGDRLDNDIIPAKAAGMKTVWIKQGFGALQRPSCAADAPDHTIEGLSELLNIF